MPEILSLEDGLCLDDLGERVFGVLVRVGRESAERFVFGCRIDPTLEGRAVMGAPVLDGETEVRAPQQEAADGSEELVAPGLELVDQAL